jgi:hypothetical protein
MTDHVIAESRNLRCQPFQAPDDPISVGEAWQEWVESLERQFVKIRYPVDQEDAMIIYGGREIARLANSLPATQDSGDLDQYKKPKQKLDNYFLPKKNKHLSQDEATV